MVVISLGLKWNDGFGRRIGNGYQISQYNSDLSNVAGEGIEWCGMLFAYLPLDCTVVLSK